MARMKRKILSVIICVCLLLVACSEKEQSATDIYKLEKCIEPELHENIGCEPIGMNAVSAVKGSDDEITSNSAREETQMTNIPEQEGWVYKKIENSMLPESIGKDETILMACICDYRTNVDRKGGVGVRLEGYYRICIVFEDGTMFCANLDLDDLCYEVNEIPDHIQDWQDIYYVGKLDVQELIAEIDHINTTPNCVNNESLWIAPDRRLNNIFMYVYRGEDSKEGQEILGRHMREMEDESLWFKPEMMNELHAEAVIDWFVNSPLYSYWQRYIKENCERI